MGGKDMNPRTCIVTRTEKSPDELIRFVIGPDLEVVPDLNRELPGRGVWILPERSLVDQAVQKGLFARGFKQKVKASPDLPEMVEKLLRDHIFGLLSLARKAGTLVAGQVKVEQEIKSECVSIILHATDKKGDGKRKINQLAEQSARELKTCEIFTSVELDKVSGRANTAHVALKESGITDKIGARIAKLESFANQG